MRRPLRPRAALAAAALLILACAASALGGQGVAAARRKAPAETGPASVVTQLYRDHFAHKQIWEQTYKRKKALFDPSLAAMLDEDLRAQAATPDEIVGLDFDPLIDAQEEANGFRVTGTTREGADAIVSVDVMFGKQPQKVRLRMAPSGSTWRIANVMYSEGDLVKYLKDGAEERAHPQP